MLERENQSGLTLVELMVVIVLIGLIYVVVAKGVFGTGEAAKAQLNVARMEKVKGALKHYRLNYNSYPAKLDNLVHASPDIQKSGKLFIPLVEEEELNDLWGNALIYRTENEGRGYSLKCLGADGVEGGEGANQDVTLHP